MLKVLGVKIVWSVWSDGWCRVTVSFNPATIYTSPTC